VLRIDLKTPIIQKGPFKPAKDFERTTKLIKANKILLENPYLFT
jgi:hypothetical protein